MLICVVRRMRTTGSAPHFTTKIGVEVPLRPITTCTNDAASNVVQHSRFPTLYDASPTASAMRICLHNFSNWDVLIGVLRWYDVAH